MYYVYIEAWCLGYSVNFLAGNLEFSSGDEIEVDVDPDEPGLILRAESATKT